MNGLPNTHTSASGSHTTHEEVLAIGSRWHAPDRAIRPWLTRVGGIGGVPVIGVLLAALALAACGGSSSTSGGPTPTPTPTPAYGYTAVWQQGHRVNLTRIRTPKFSSPPSYLGQVTDFKTTDPAYLCFNGTSINVWNSPDYRGLNLVYGTCLTANGPTGAWTFTYVPVFKYNAKWQGQPEILNLVANATPISKLPDATIQGSVTDFETDDQRFTCFNTTSVPVWVAPNEYPYEYVLQGTCQTPLGTWTFPHPYTYRATWAGSQEKPMPAESVDLTLIANTGPLGRLPDATPQGIVTDFQTADPVYVCLNGAPLDVWLAPQEFPKVYVVQGGCPGVSPGTWTFPQSGSTPTPTPTP
jgi:hypothetical protein